MMLQVIMYATAVALAMSVVGLAVERVAVQRGWPRRLVWVAAMTISVLFPLHVVFRTEPASIPQQRAIFASATASSVTVLPGPVSDTQSHGIAAAAVPMERLSSSGWLSVSMPHLTDRAVATTWALVSLLLLMYLTFTSVLLRSRSAAWRRDTVLGESVFISDSSGPALFGVLRPRVVVPRWFLHETVQTQTLILAHEQQHLRARDPLLLWTAALAAVLVPWNLPLWWQLHRLRLAIELDCDARVLNAGAEPEIYGNVLLSVARRAMEMPRGMVAMSEPASALERRIRNLAPVRGRFTTLSLMGSVVLAAAGISAAVALEAPVVPASGKMPVPRDGLSGAAQREQLTTAATNPQIIQNPGSSDQRAMLAAGVQNAPAGLKLKSPFVPANYDGWRFAQYLQNVMLQRHPELLLPSNGAELNQVTVLLTEDGQVDREVIARMTKSELRQVPGAPDQNEINRYAGVIAGRLNLDVSRIGTYSVTYPARQVRDPNSGMPGAEIFILVYAWPRRAGESAPSFIPPNQSVVIAPGDGPTPAADSAAEAFDAAAALAMVEQHMPDAFRKSDAAGSPVIILSRSGEFIRAGRQKFPGNAPGAKLLQDPLLLGIPTVGVSWQSVRNAAGASVNVLFAWQGP